MKVCRDELNRVCGKTEHWNPHVPPVGVRQDLFGFIDVIAISSIEGIIAIQCTGPSGHADHKRKILENRYAPAWLQSGGKIELWSWRKLKVKRGGKQATWQPRVEPITIDYFLGEPNDVKEKCNASGS